MAQGIVFLGTSRFAAAVLERMAASGDQRPDLVITRPDRPSGRGRKMTPPPVAHAASVLGIACEQPARVNEPQARELIAAVARRAGGGEAVRATVVVCAFGALIREPLLSDHDILNVHPSLLPRWRGAAPIERAIMAGDELTGVSIMRLTEGLDSGPVCLAAEADIVPQDTYGTLSARLEALAGELIVRALRERPAFREQPEQGVTYAEKIEPADRLLDPARPAQELERAVRALHPHIGARARLADGGYLGVQRAALVHHDAAVPHQDAAVPHQDAAVPHQDAAVRSEGTGAEGADDGAGILGPGLAHEGERLLLRCSPGTLELLVVQPPGGRSMDAAAYLRGRPAAGRR